MAAATLSLARTGTGLEVWVLVNDRSLRVHSIGWSNLSGRAHRLDVVRGGVVRRYALHPGGGEYRVLRDRYKLNRCGKGEDEYLSWGFDTLLSREA